MPSGFLVPQLSSAPSRLLQLYCRSVAAECTAHGGRRARAAKIKDTQWLAATYKVPLETDLAYLSFP